MRKFLLAGVVFGCLIGSARAQLPVTDGAALIAHAKELAQSLKSYLVQGQQLIHEASSDISLAQTVASTIQHPSLGAVMGLMNMARIENPLPVNPYAIMSLTSGYQGANINGLLGKLSGLGGLITTSYSNDNLYTCTTNSFACRQNQQIAWGQAGLKGIVSDIYADMVNHDGVLKGLRAEAAATTDPAQRENIILQTNIENTWAANSLAKLQASIAMAEAQDRMAGTQRAQKHMMDGASFLAAVPNGG